MRNTNWIVTAGLLLSLSAAAQQPAGSQPPSDPAAAQSAASAQTAAPAPSQSAPVQPVGATSTTTGHLPAPPKAEAAPTTMDQVVDRFIVREQGLIKMLETRTPVVETYLQNLQLDPALGPVPKDDRYFLGRMDLSASIDRKDYIK